MAGTQVKGKGVVICLAPGHGSGDYYAQGDEMIVVLEGEGMIITENERKALKKGESVFVQKGSGFSLRNGSGKDFIFTRLMREKPDRAG